MKNAHWGLFVTILFNSGAFSKLIITVDPGGSSAMVSYPDEEHIIYIPEGAGILNYGDQSYELTMNDFVYIPTGIEYGLSNPDEYPLKAIIMDFTVAQKKVKSMPGYWQ